MQDVEREIAKLRADTARRLRPFASDRWVLQAVYRDTLHPSCTTPEVDAQVLDVLIAEERFTA